MKRVLTRIGMLLVSCAMFATVAFAASSTASIGISTSDYSKVSSAVGLGKKASFYASNYSTSTGSMYVEGKACWDGWPYTTEVSTTLKAGQSATLTDSQTKSSSFKIKLSGYNVCNGYGSVTLK